MLTNPTKQLSSRDRAGQPLLAQSNYKTISRSISNDLLQDHSKQNLNGVHKNLEFVKKYKTKKYVFQTPQGLVNIGYTKTVPGADLETESTTHPKIDYSLLRANNPFLSWTVKPHTKVEGAGWDGLTGTISPHPTYRVVPVNPSRFIRTTCAKARLPPGIYSFLKENSTAPLYIVVKTELGKYEEIESYNKVIHLPVSCNLMKKTLPQSLTEEDGKK